MNMKFLLSLLLVAVIGSGAFAQEKRGKDRNPEEMATRMTEKMVDKLGLNADQKEKLYQSNLRLAQTKKENREEMQAAGEQHDADMQEILTEDQYKIYKEERSKMKERTRGRHRHQGERPERKD
ncbi:MAG: DUF4890 domain-containing protein [Owenweeksia sp.]